MKHVLNEVAHQACHPHDLLHNLRCILWREGGHACLLLAPEREECSGGRSPARVLGAWHRTSTEELRDLLCPRDLGLNPSRDTGRFGIVVPAEYHTASASVQLPSRVLRRAPDLC